MKTSVLTPTVTRSLVGFLALTVMAQLIGGQQADILPSTFQPALVHVASPSLKPTVVSLDCTDSGIPCIGLTTGVTTEV